MEYYKFHKWLPFHVAHNFYQSTCVIFQKKAFSQPDFIPQYPTITRSGSTDCTTQFS